MSIRGITDFGDRLSQQWQNPSWSNLLIAAPWILGLVVLIYGSFVKHDVAGRQTTVTGQITSDQPGEHDCYGYAFALNGRSYRGCDALPHKPVLGEQVTVFYDAAAPETNSLTDFDQLSLELLGPVPFLALASTAVVLVIVYRRRRARRAVPAS